MTKFWTIEMESKRIRSRIISQNTVFGRENNIEFDVNPRTVSALKSRFFENIVIPSKLDANRIIKFWITLNKSFFFTCRNRFLTQICFKFHGYLYFTFEKLGILPCWKSCQFVGNTKSCWKLWGCKILEYFHLETIKHLSITCLVKISW